ncbi:MAG: hypothetical protein ABIJ08_03090, partial [Nanoarchaeota archaeon]
MNSKEKISAELDFLKESLDAGVITRDEYEEGKRKLEDKLKQASDQSIEIKEIDRQKSVPIIGQEKEEEPEEIIDETEPEQEPEEDQYQQESKFEETEQEPEEDQDQQEPESDHAEEPEEDQDQQESKFEETEQEPDSAEHKETEDKKSEKSGSKKDKRPSNKRIFLFAIFTLIILYLIFNIPSCSKIQPIEIKVTDIDNQTIAEEKIPICSSDEDCNEEGKIGICQNPSTKESECMFEDPIKLELTIINDPKCKSCDTSRMIDILKQLFLDIDIVEIKYDSPEAKSLISQLKIDSLPAYIFNSTIERAVRFENFKRALLKQGDSYLISPTASGSNYLFNRPEQEKQLWVYVLSNDTKEIDINIDEVLDLFGNDMIYSKKI